MKKYLLTLIAMTSPVLLTACQTQPSQVSPQESTQKAQHKSVASEADTTTEAQPSDEVLYDSILQTYHAEYAQKQHAFYDINNNGTKELIIGSPEYIEAIYYLKNGTTPEIAVARQVDMSSGGGGREGLAIYKDGSISYSFWMALSPESEEKVYRLRADNTGIETVNEGTFNYVEDDIEVVLGLDQTEPVDITQIDWQESPGYALARQNSMDIKAIQRGDFSSLVGTWQNANGSTFVFDANGLIETTNEVILEGTRIENGALHANLRAGNYGAMMIFIPKDTIMPIGTDGLEDGSDTSRDRILSGHQLVVSDDSEFYYRVD
ncbi:DUF6287 domain-containing protein [Streptococcus rifensis]